MPILEFKIEESGLEIPIVQVNFLGNMTTAQIPPAVSFFERQLYPAFFENPI